MIFDPSFLFCLGALSTPLLLAFRDNPQNFSSELRKYILDPALIAGISYIILALLFSRKSLKLSFKEKLISNWFLFNGAIIHLTMDGLSGGHHMLPLMEKNYAIVDQRFKTDEPNSWIITQIELFLMSPLCFLCYLSLRKGNITKFGLCAATAALQLMGTIIFAGSEIVSNFPNTPIDRKFEFTNHHLLYFWFGFGCNVIWIIFPTLIMINSVLELGKINNNKEKVA